LLRFLFVCLFVFPDKSFFLFFSFSFFFFFSCSNSAPKEFEVPVTTGNFYTNATQKTPNGLADIHDLVQRKIVNSFMPISELLHEDAFSKEATASFKFGKYEVKSGFPSMRLGALEVMFEGRPCLRLCFLFLSLFKIFSFWNTQPSRTLKTCQTLCPSSLLSCGSS